MIGILLMALLVGAVALTIWKRLYLAMGALAALVIASVLLAVGYDDLALGYQVFFFGLLSVFPASIYLADERRRRKVRRGRITRARERTGREVPGTGRGGRSRG